MGGWRATESSVPQEPRASKSSPELENLAFETDDARRASGRREWGVSGGPATGRQAPLAEYEAAPHARGARVSPPFPPGPDYGDLGYCLTPQMPGRSEYTAQRFSSPFTGEP